MATNSRYNTRSRAENLGSDEVDNEVYQSADEGNEQEDEPIEDEGERTVVAVQTNFEASQSSSSKDVQETTYASDVSTECYVRWKEQGRAIGLSGVESQTTF